MTKKQFIQELRKKLSALPKRDAEERLNFYSEMIDDRMEEGLSEEEAVKAVGSAENIAKQIPGTKDAEGSPEPLRAWEIVLLIFASPVWAPLLIAALAVYYSIFIVLWSLEITLWAVEAPFLIFSYISKYLLIACKSTTVYLAKFTKRGTVCVGRAFRRVRGEK